MSCVSWPWKSATFQCLGCFCNRVSPGASKLRRFLQPVTEAGPRSKDEIENIRLFHFQLMNCMCLYLCVLNMIQFLDPMMFLGLHSVAHQLFCDEESLGYRKFTEWSRNHNFHRKIVCRKQVRTLTTWQSQLAGEIQEVKPIYSDQHFYLKLVLGNWDMQIYLFGESQLIILLSLASLPTWKITVAE